MARTAPSSKAEIFLPLKPRATQRSRCACRGRFPSVYTDPAYRAWKDEAIELLKGISPPDGFDFAEGPLAVRVEVLLAKPKTTKRGYPRGDADNYLKGVYDAITQDGRWWKDDDQVTTAGFSKRWAVPGEPEGYHITIERED